MSTPVWMLPCLALWQITEYRALRIYITSHRSSSQCKTEIRYIRSIFYVEMLGKIFLCFSVVFYISRFLFYFFNTDDLPSSYFPLHNHPKSESNTYMFYLCCVLYELYIYYICMAETCPRSLQHEYDISITLHIRLTYSNVL